MAELLPCPCCGSEHVESCREFWSGAAPADSEFSDEVFCDDCGVTAPSIEAWNTRAERTCRNISNPPEGFYCSECHWGDFAEPSHLLTSAKFTGSIHGGLNYCPNCGAKVVSHEE